MRRISKPWPPGNVSPEGQDPQSMKAAEKSFLVSVRGSSDPARHARIQFFDCLDKSKLREVLLKEQRYLCVYCQARIGETTIPRIEHWRPLSEVPELALRWQNLYLSCAFNATCDSAKGDRRLAWDEDDEDLPWPTDAPYHDWLGYSRGGKIYVQSNAPLSTAQRKALELALDDRRDGDRQRTSILNLNHPSLVSARKAIIDSERSRMDTDYPKRRASSEARHSRASGMLARKKYAKFISVRVAWLTKTMGKNR